MKEPIVELKNITKDYVLDTRHYGLKNIALHLPRYIMERRNPKRFIALQDFSLTINRGETIGVIGPNGCGKTTLLSIIGGVLKRYEGECSVKGRVSMMLALQSGFERELSGRENIILNGVLQGMSRKKMFELMDEVIDFAGIGDFIDAPIYQYSSGMQARLGFAIATSIQPEILLIDEVLAVGDEEFAAKCKERIAELLARNTTLVLVSHKMNDIKSYCNRVIRIDHGRKTHDMPADEYFKHPAKG